MKRTTTTLISMMLLAPAVLAQTPSTATQQRLALLNALRAIETYETSATLFNDEAEENFRYLFGSDSTMIFNDLPGLALGDSLYLDEYVELLRGQRGAFVALSNIRGGSPQDDGDRWLVPIFFDKEIRYNTPCGAIISSTEYYDDKPYRMEALVAVDKSDYEASIASLTGSIDSNKKPLAPGFLLAIMNDPRDKDVRNHGRKLEFNKNGQAFVAQPVAFSYADDDMNMKVDSVGTGDCRKFSFSYHPRRWRVTPYYEMAFGGNYSVDAATGINASSSGANFGVDFGYILPSKSKLKIGLFAGIGFSTGNIKLSADAIDYHYDADANADMDADTYVRYYELSGVAQSVKLSHLTIPIYAEFDLRLSSRLSVFLDLGVKTYFNAGSKIDAFSGEVYSYGIYPQYGDLRMDEEWLNDFGRRTIGLSDISTSATFKGFSADVLAGLGVRVKIAGALSAEAGVQFDVPAIKRIETREITSLPSGATSAINVPVSFTVASGQTIDNTLLDYCKVKSNPLRLKIGLNYKF